MSYEIYRETYSEHQVYRYQVTDGTAQICCSAEPTGLLLPNPSRMVTLFDADYEPLGRVEPPPPSVRRWGGTYTVRLGEAEEPQAAIEEQWTLVDLILLRLPDYLIHLGDETFVARGSRYGQSLYEIFRYHGQEEAAEEEMPPGAGPTASMDEEEMRRVLEEEVVDSQLREKPVGYILRPERGPSYIVDTEEASLRQAPWLLTALVILVDLHLHSQFV